MPPPPAKAGNISPNDAAISIPAHDSDVRHKFCRNDGIAFLRSKRFRIDMLLLLNEYVAINVSRNKSIELAKQFKGRGIHFQELCIPYARKNSIHNTFEGIRCDLATIS